MLIASECFLKSWQYFASYGKSIFYWRYLSYSWYADTKIKAWFDVCGSNPSRLFSSSRGKLLPLLANQYSVSNIVFTWAANLSNSWYVNTKSRAWQMSVDQIFHVILFFLPRRRKIQNGREKMMTRFNKIFASRTIQPNQFSNLSDIFLRVTDLNDFFKKDATQSV